MARRGMAIVAGLLLIGAPVAGAHEGDGPHDEMKEMQAASGGEQTLTGEVIDVMCYLGHGSEGMGKAHAGCGKKCIESGLPVAIKSGDQLYLAAMADHSPANKALADLAGEQVTVRGSVLEKDGQRVILISKVEKAGNASAGAPAAASYVCKMCGIKQDKPGACPKCGMPLEPAH